jgi:hypothetical protein
VSKICHTSAKLRSPVFIKPHLYGRPPGVPSGGRKKRSHEPKRCIFLGHICLQFHWLSQLTHQNKSAFGDARKRRPRRVIFLFIQASLHIGNSWFITPLIHLLWAYAHTHTRARLASKFHDDTCARIAHCVRNG